MDCSRCLHARLVISKGEKLYTMKDLSLKLLKTWRSSGTWKENSSLVNFMNLSLQPFGIYECFGHEYC